MTARRIWSVGHGARSLSEFLALLRSGDVEVLADVRRFPHSRRHPHFDAKALRLGCEKEGIEWIHLGDDLGGFRDDGYEKHLATEAFARGLARLADLATRRPTAFCCAERLPEHCHRLFIATALEERGWTVRHVVEPGREHVPERPERQGELFGD